MRYRAGCQVDCEDVEGRVHLSFLFLEVVVVLEMADSPPAKRRFAPTQAADVDKAAVSSVPTNTKAATISGCACSSLFARRTAKPWT